MANKVKGAKNANYNFKRQVEPSKRMGEGDLANLPNRPIYMKFSDDNGYRDGIINSFTCNVEEVSEIEENERY